MADDYKVPYTKILAINPHPNADRLELATIYGFQVIIAKDRYKVGDPVVYIPIDSILPPELDAKLFPIGSKIKLHHFRVRQIRIRGLASQGMVVALDDLTDKVNFDYIGEEQDLAAILGVTKYDPPELGPAQTVGASKQRNKKTENPLFHQYNGLSSIKWFPLLFQEGEQVVIQEKLHGTNARAGLLPFVANSLWKKLLKFLRLAPKYEKCYGSNKVEISAASSYKGFYGEDLWGRVFKQDDTFNKILPGETVFGEIIGPNIQKNYSYGLAEPRFVLFDVKILNSEGKQTWMSPEEVEKFAYTRGFELVPTLYKGPFNKELAYQLTLGPSKYNNTQKIREGIVIRAKENFDIDGNKKALKWVSETYLSDSSNSDFH